MTKLVLLLLATVLDHQAILQGKIVDPDGLPIAGARVVIAGAKPKEGPATRCTRCYPDCGRYQETDPDGLFRFDDVDDSLLYELAIAAPGFVGNMTEEAVPAETMPAADPDFVFELRKPTAVGARQARGQIVDGQGRPALGVVVMPRMVHQANRMTVRTAGLVSPLAITDAEGRFQLDADQSVTGLTIRIQGDDSAIQDVEWAELDAGEQRVQLERGASIRGRLVLEGEPQPGVQLGIAQEDRSGANTVTPMALSTDAEGFFQFDHIPSGREYTLYSLINTNARCVLPVHLVAVPENGKRAELGEVAATAPSKLTIKLISGDQVPFPDRSYIYVSRSKAWESARLFLKPQAEQVFELTDVGNEMFQIGVRVAGFKALRTVPQRSPDMNRLYPVLVEGDTTISIVLVRED